MALDCDQIIKCDKNSPGKPTKFENSDDEKQQLKQELIIDKSAFTHLFLVIDLGELDLR